jgi:hypothetical protein
MSPIDAIIAIMYRTRNRLLRWGGVLMGLSLVGLGTVANIPQLPNKPLISLLLLCTFLFISGLYLLILAATILHPTKHPIIKHIRHDKYQIVWVYSFININMPFGVEMFRLVTIWVHYRDGSQQHLRIGHAHLLECMTHLETKLPQATFGYSIKNEQLYRANPELLERET